MAFTPEPASRAAVSLLLRLESASSLACAELHPQGACLLAGSESGDALIYATSGGVVMQRLAGSSNSSSATTCVAWAELNSAERVIAGHKSGNVHVWDVESNSVVSKLVAHRADITCVTCMGPLSLLATGSVDTNVKLWSLAGGEADRGGSGGSTQQPRLMKTATQTLRGHLAPITRLRFTPDGELLISGDKAGGLRVWHVAGGTAGRLLHNLTGHHTAAITGIACHPEERLFVTCSLDRTIRVWDMDVQPGTCIGVHGPEGRREARAVAFAAGGLALLAAYPYGLRTFTLDPLVHHDAADVQWSKVCAIRYTDGKCIGISLFKGDAWLYCVDLTKLKPFAKEAALRKGSNLGSSSQLVSGTNRASAEHGMKDIGPSLASKLRLGSQSQKGNLPPPRSSGDPTATISAAWPPAAAASPPPAGTEQEAPAALAGAQRQRPAAAVLEPRAVNAGPSAEIFGPAQRPARRHAQHAPFTAAPSRPAPASASATRPAPANTSSPPSRSTPGIERKASRHCLSAQENAVAGDWVGRSPECKPESTAGPVAAGPHKSTAAPPSILAVATHRGFQAAAMRRCTEQCSMMHTKRSLWREVQGAVRRGALREALRLLEDSNDLSVAANVIESGAMQRQRDRFTLELCTAVLPLTGALLASGTPVHSEAALQLLDAILGRWGTYVSDVISKSPVHSKVDLELERRQDRTRALHSGLKQLLPTLERLAVPLGGGRALQMLDRLKAL